MSVTFEVNRPTIEAWVGQCGCGAVRTAEVYRTYEAARAATPVCGDDYCAAGHGYPTPAEELPSLNVSNLNGGMLIDLLGLPDLVGSADADDFLGRVLIAQGVNPTDAGVPAVQDGNWVECGRREGYADDRLSDLRTIAEAARARSVNVQWA